MKLRIDVLPDDILLEIFDFYMIMSLLSYGVKGEIEAWHPLVHVCRRWRTLVFLSPCRLNLQLCCTPKTPAKDTLDVWPALPLIVRGSMSLSSSMDNITGVLRQNNRVCQLSLWGLGWQLEEVLAMMQVPFPELTDLQLFSDDETPPVIPDSFLGGSVPRLLIFELDGIPFPGLPKLLLSANHLVRLLLSDIPHSGYIPPEAMIALLSVSSSLETLHLEFLSPQSCPESGESRLLPPPKRSILPALEVLRFKGVTEYLEDLVTRIDTPRLIKFHTTFFNQIDFDCPRLVQFIDCTPTLRELPKARVKFDFRFARVELSAGPRSLEIAISCREPDWQLSSITQVCNSSLPSPSMVEVLHIERRAGYLRHVWENDAIESTLWLQVLLSFTAVKNLYLSKEFTPGIVTAVHELAGARMAEVLPSLENIFAERLKPSGQSSEKTKLVTVRLQSGHPIDTSGRRIYW